MSLPRIEPIHPVRSKLVPLGRGWIYELKLDGFRGVLSVERGRGVFTSKSGRRMRRFDPLAQAIAHSLRAESAILDGEIIAVTAGRPDFRALFFRRGSPAYAAFDLLWLNGRDLRAQPLWRRKRALRTLVEDTPVGYVEHVDDPALIVETAVRDLEGIVAKRRNEAYSAEAEWVKVKHPRYSQFEGRWELFAKSGPSRTGRARRR